MLCKTNILNIFYMDHFFHIFVISRSTKILKERNLWLGIYVSYIFKKKSLNVRTVLPALGSLFNDRMSVKFIMSYLFM